MIAIPALTPVAPVVDFKAARPFAGDHDLGVAIAELDLPNMTAGVVDLLGYQRRAFLATRRTAGTRITA